MPSKYISKREILINFLKETIIPNIRERKDVDYNLLIDLLVSEKFVSFKLAKECVDLIIRNGEIIKLADNVLTIPENQVLSWLIKDNQKIRQKENEEKKINEILEA